MEALYGSHWILTLLLAIPLVGAVACVAGGEGRARWTALLTTLLVLALSLPLFWTFRIGTAEFQNAVSLPWIERWGIRYAIGMDGISLLMILLTTSFPAVQELSFIPAIPLACFQIAREATSSRSSIPEEIPSSRSWLL